MDVEVSLLKPEDIPGAIETIQKAFDDDPYNRWIFPDRKAYNLERNSYSLTLRCNWGFRNALFYVARDTSSSGENGKILGTAMWMPPVNPHLPETWDSYLQGLLLWFQQGIMNIKFWGRGGLNVKRYYIWKREQALAQKELLTDSKGYYFCNIITVLPEAQGRGVGKKLFKAVTDKADEEGVCCYLESSRADPNVKIYEKLGFRMCREMWCVDEETGDGCQLFCMIRDPVTPTSKSAVGIETTTATAGEGESSSIQGTPRVTRSRAAAAAKSTPSKN